MLPAIDPRSVASGPETQVLDRIVLLALLAAADALADAGIEVGRDVDPDRIGVIVGGVGGMATLEAAGRSPGPQRGRAAVSPYLLHRHPAEHARRPGSPSRTASAATAPSVGTACASGAQSVADGGAADPGRRGRRGGLRGQRGAALPDLRRHLRQRPGAGPGLGRPDRGQPAVRPAAQRVRARRGRRRCWCWSAPSTPTPGARRLRRGRRLGRHHRRAPPDHAAPGRRRARPSACAGRWPTRAWTPADDRLRQRPRHRHQARRRRRDHRAGRRCSARRAAGQLHQGAHRAPARRVRGGGGGGHRAGAAAAGCCRRRTTSTTRTRTASWTTSAASPGAAGVEHALSNSFGFGGQNVSLLLRPGRRAGAGPAGRGDDRTATRAAAPGRQSRGDMGRLTDGHPRHRPHRTVRR